MMSVIIKIIRKIFGIEFINKIFLFSFPRFNSSLLKIFGAKIGIKNVIHSPLIMVNSINDYKNFTMGSFCHLGKNVLLDLADKIDIGNRVTISMGTFILTHFDVGYSKLKEYGYNRKTGKVIIEDDVYIGANSIILSGIKIGKNSLISAGAVVTKDVPPNSLFAENPARLVKKIKK